MSPRNVRNFWIEGRTDSGTTFGTGPRTKDGGFIATIYQRHNGKVVEVLKIEGRATVAGRLHLIVERGNGGHGLSEPFNFEVFPDDASIQVRSDR